MEKVAGTSGGSAGGEFIPFGIKGAADEIARRKAEEVREGYQQAVDEFNTVPYWRQSGLTRDDIERAMEGAWREDERVLEGEELTRIIVPFEKEPRHYGFFEALAGRDEDSDHEYRLIQDL